MKHEQAAPLVSDWMEGELPEDVSHEMGEHVDGCTDCREQAVAYRTLANAMRATAEPHPSEEALVAWAVDRPGREEGEIGAHLQSCGRCLHAVETIEAAERQATSRVASIARAQPLGSGRAWRAVAAVLIATLGLYVGFLGGQRSRTAGIDAAGGVAELPLVSSAVRDAGAATRILLDPGRPIVPIAVAPVLPAGRPEAAYIFEIRDSAGAAAWTIELAATRVRELIEASGALVLLVPSGSLEPGRHELRVVPAAGGDALMRQPIEIVAAGER